jgi:hypothetical protein
MTLAEASDSQEWAKRLSVSISGTIMYIVLGLRAGGLGVGLNMVTPQFIDKAPPQLPRCNVRVAAVRGFADRELRIGIPEGIPRTAAMTQNDRHPKVLL